MHMNSIGDEVKKLYHSDFENDRNDNIKIKPSLKSLLYIVVIFVFVLINIIVGTYYFNTFATMEQYIYAQKSQIEKEYKRRIDLIPNLIHIARDYAHHERELFNYVSDARSLIESSEKLEEAMKSMDNKQIEKTLTSLIALAEQYPDLKATQSFQDLMEKVELTEDRIATARESFIILVRDYNSFLVTFPSNLYNHFFGFQLIEYYQFGNDDVPVFDTQTMPGGD